MIRVLIWGLLALLPASALAQPAPPTGGQPAQERWVRSKTHIMSAPSGVAFPLQAGTISLAAERDFSHPELGIDSGLQYRSQDGELIGTVYFYLPGLAHAGLSGFATEQAILGNSSTPVRRVRSEVVAAGGIRQAAVRNDYENYRGGHASSAAFIKAGRWIIKIRITGPGSRAREVDAATSALLAEAQFGGKNPVLQAQAVAVSDCPKTSQADAKLLPDPPGPDLAAHGFLAVFDGGGNVATDESGKRRDLPSRIPTELCLSSRLRVGDVTVPILRSAPGAPSSVDGRTRLLAVIGDAGTTLEVVQAENLGRYLMLYHQIGSTAVLGGYDEIPSDKQIGELLANPNSEAGRIRVPVFLKPDGGPEMHLPALPKEEPRTTT